MTIILLIEHGQLLKPYARPWRPDGWGPAPPGWTAADDEWIEQRTAELMDGWRKVLEKEPVLAIAKQQARQERGELLQAERKPWPGWVPTNPRADRRITRAYRELFKAMNGNGAKVKWPPDGYYVFANGKMQAVNGE